VKLCLREIRILSTESTYVIPDQTAFEQLISKHPKSPDDRRNVPMARGAPLECTTSDIVSALRSFKPGSAAGPDGLRPQHIQDMVLRFGDYILCSEEGVQQGDPLGPLLFSLTLPKALSLSRCDLTVAYLDDVTLGDSIDSLGGEVVDFHRRASSIGLTLNVKKVRNNWAQSSVPQHMGGNRLC